MSVCWGDVLPPRVEFSSVPSSARVFAISGTTEKIFSQYPVNFRFCWQISIVRGVLAGYSRRPVPGQFHRPLAWSRVRPGEGTDAIVGQTLSRSERSKCARTKTSGKPARTAVSRNRLPFLCLLRSRVLRELPLILRFEPERESLMKRILRNCLASFSLRSPVVAIGLVLLLAAPLFAQQGNSPWENAVNVLMTAFTSTIARGLSLVAIVVSGLTFAFGEGGSKRVLAGVLFGVGMAIAAVNFLAWLFPGA